MTLDHAHPAPADGPTMAVLPLALLASGIGHPIAGRALQVMRRRHRAVFARLEELGEAAFLIDPTDLPLFFVLRPAGADPALTLHFRRGGEPPAAAAIRAPLATLIALLEGRIDGDAAFFGRDLMVEGDIGAALVLRNALEAEEIRLAPDLLAMLGPLGRPFMPLLPHLEDALGTVARRLGMLRAALMRPLADRIAVVEAELAALRCAREPGARPPRMREADE